MKKKYIHPQIVVKQMEAASVICGSQDVHATVNGDDIGYGGVDEEGQRDPSSRRRDVWDDEEEL